MSGISKINERMDETGELLGRVISVMFLGACLVVIPCAVALLVFFTFAAIHPGDDLHFGGGSGSRGESGDIIVLPTQPF
jgi:hypothetical protein